MRRSPKRFSVSRQGQTWEVNVLGRTLRGSKMKINGDKFNAGVNENYMKASGICRENVYDEAQFGM